MSHEKPVFTLPRMQAGHPVEPAAPLPQGTSESLRPVSDTAAILTMVVILLPLLLSYILPNGE